VVLVLVVDVVVVVVVGTDVDEVDSEFTAMAADASPARGASAAGP